MSDEVQPLAAPRRCSICNTERGVLIHAFLAAGRTPTWIERQMREMRTPTKAETIRKHRDICLQGRIENTVLMDAASGKAQTVTNPDFAEAIRKEANALLAQGRLTVTAAHGLKAQELLDRRAEKAADRALLVQLAGLLAGRPAPEDLIEGEWREVSSDSVDETPSVPQLEGVSHG